MKNMYDIVPRGNEYIYGKILSDNFNVCHSCRQFYPIDRCPDAVLADPKLLSKKSVYDFIISDMVYNHHFSVHIAKKSFLEQLGWDDVLKNFSIGKLYYPVILENLQKKCYVTQLKPCSNKNTGNMTFTVGGKVQAGGYIDFYGEMQYAPNEELNFDYGVKIGASSGLGAGIYVSVSGQIGISYIF